MNEKVKQLRRNRGWTQNEVSRRMGKKNSRHISMIERGERPNMSLMTACEIARVFDITLDELVKDTEFDLK